MRRRSISHLLVIMQLAGVCLSIFPPGWQNLGHPLWLFLCAGGAFTGLWTLYHNTIGNFSIYPEPKPQAELITTGPYRFVRHPMYASLVLMMCGIAFYNFQLSNFAGLVLVVVAVTGKARLEEQFMLARFPGYAHYMALTRRFIPSIVFSGHQCGGGKRWTITNAAVSSLKKWWAKIVSML